MNEEITQDPISKKCSTDCPNCGVDEDDVEFGGVVCDTDIGVIYIPCSCKKCGCEFKMYFGYTDTEFYMEQCEKVPCPYPMSDFFNYMDEVLTGERVSTPEDCKKCDEVNCINKHCLISESEKPDYARDLYLAAKKVIENGAMELADPQTAAMSEQLAQAVKNYERRQK